MEVAQRHGLKELSQARVAAAAGVRQSHLTYYFPTRKDLITALVQTIHAEISDALGALLPANEGGITSVDEGREFFARRIGEPLLGRLILALMNAADEDPSLRQWLADFDNEVTARIGEILARLGLRPSEDELALLHASFIGAAILGAQPGTVAEAGRAARLARLAFERMVQATAPSAQRTSRPSRRRKTP